MVFRMATESALRISSSSSSDEGNLRKRLSIDRVGVVIVYWASLMAPNSAFLASLNLPELT